MKIIFVNRFYAPDHSATSQMLTDLATALAAGGADLQVVTSRLRYDDPSGSLPRHEVVDGVRVHRIWTSTFGRGSLAGRALDYVSFYLAASIKLIQLLRRDDVVVAMTDPPLISVPVGWVARLRGARAVNWLQDIFPEVAAELGMRGVKGRGRLDATRAARQLAAQRFRQRGPRPGDARSDGDARSRDVECGHDLQLGGRRRIAARGT